MPVVSPTNKPAKVDFQLSIGLEPPAKRIEDDDKVKPLSFTCKVHPNKTNSPEFTVKIYQFSDGSPEEFIETCKKLETVEMKQNIKKNDEKVVLVQQIFEGALLEAFENELPSPSSTDPVTDAHIEKGMIAMTKIIFPDKAARNQKKAMKKIRKPKDMTFREFANRMKKINEMLPWFPPLADGSQPKPMPQDEFLEMLHDALPKIGYQNKMQEHDYDPSQDTFHRFVEWIERRCEPFDDREPRNKTNKNNKDALDKSIPKKSNKSKRKIDNQQSQASGERSGKKGRKFCYHHKWCDHTTDECKVMQQLHEKHAPPRKHYDKTAHDLHLMEERVDERNKEFVDSPEFSAACKKFCAHHCSRLFKVFKNEIKEDFHMMEPNDDDNEERAYLKKLKLNQASDESTDEEKNESY